MENYNVVVQFISSVGFPIAVSCALLWYCFKLNEVHKDESKEFTDAINNVTLALQQLTDFLKR